MNQRIQRFDRILKLREDGRRAEQVTLAAERREERGVMDRLSALEGERAEAIEAPVEMLDLTGKLERSEPVAASAERPADAEANP